MKVRTLIVALAVSAFAISPACYAAEGTNDPAKTELEHLGQLLIGFSYMTLGAGDVDGAVAVAAEATHVARLSGDAVLLGRAENHRRAYRGIGLIVTSDAAAKRGDTIVVPELKELGCRLLNEVLPGEEWLGPIVEKVKEFCVGVTVGTESDGAKKQAMLEVAAHLLVDADRLYRTSPGNAVGNATAALDIMHAVGAKELAAGTKGVVFAYEALSLMRLAEAFDEERTLPLASGKVRALACGMSETKDPSAVPILEGLRRRCFI